MRYFLASFFFHLLTLLPLLGWPVSPDSSIEESRIVVEIVSLPTSTPLAADHPQKKQQTLSQKQRTSEKSRSSTPAIKEVQEDPVSRLSSDQQSSEQSQQIRLSYAQQLKAFIEDNKFYPRTAVRLKQTGVVKIRLEINEDGLFQNIQLVQASPHKNLNQAALELLKKLKRFKPLPKELLTTKGFVVPIAYQISGGQY